MKTIHKYDLSGSRSHLIPEGFKILHVASQYDRICVWCEVDTASKNKLVKFRVYGTGWNLDEEPSGHYIGTVLTQESYVWHIYHQKD